MNLIDMTEIDFEKFEKDYPEQAHVVPAWAYSDQVIDRFKSHEAFGLPLPWSKTHPNVRIRSGEISVWAGINGSGKSLLLNLITLQAMKMGEISVIASLEMHPVHTLARMTRQALGVRLPLEESIHRFHQWTDGKLWFYAQQDTVQSKRILALIRYCHEALSSSGVRVKVNHIVIDSLMKCGIGVDDYNGQKGFVDKLCALARDTGIHIHLVAHERKRESARNLGDKFSVKGASEIIDQVDNCFLFWRNKDKEEAEQSGEADEVVSGQPDAILRCDKQRHGEWEGKILLWYERDSMQYVAAEGLRPIPFFNPMEFDPEAQAERKAIQEE